MNLKKISLLNFRNFDNSSFDFNPFLTVIVGQNSVGKTNLLESIFFVCRGRGFREDKQEELIHSDKAKTQVEAFFEDKLDKLQSRIILTTGETLGKTYQLNKIKKRATDYLSEIVPIAIFSPSFMYVIDTTTAERREFLDQVISLIDNEYKKKLTNYEMGLRKRNKILEITKDVEKLRSELEFWDNYLIKEAEYIVKKREDLVDFLNSHKKLDTKIFSIKYAKNIISKESLAENFQRQFYIKKTLVGPQRDIFEIYIGEKDREKNHYLLSISVGE